MRINDAARWLLPAGLLVIGACDSPSRPFMPKPLPSPSADLLDGVHNGGNPHFFFLPPMVPQPSYSGTSDGTESPVVKVCMLVTTNNTSACGTLIAWFTTGNGTGAQLVRYDATAQQYIVNWPTGQCLTGACTLDASQTYRVRVLAGALELGHADIQVVMNGSEMKDVNTNQYIALQANRTLPIKFRIEQGAVVVSQPGTPVPVGPGGGTVATADGMVALSIPSGALSTAASITVQPASGYPTGTSPVAAPVDLGPTGTTFATPVTLTLGFDPTKLPPGVPPSALRLYTSDGTGWKVVPRSVVNSVDNTVSAPVTHFSTYDINVYPNSVTGVPSATTIAVGQTTVLTGYVYGFMAAPQSYCYYIYNGPFTAPTYYCTHWTSTQTYGVPNQAVSWIWSSAPGATTPVAAFSGTVTYTNQGGSAQSPPLLGLVPGSGQAIGSVDPTTSLGQSSVTVTVTPPTVPANDLASGCGHSFTGIAFDGAYYYVAEGHDGGAQCITRYDGTGAKVDSKTFLIDMRGLHFVPTTGLLVTRAYNGPFYTVNYAAGTSQQLTGYNPTPASWGYEAQPAADPDGQTWWTLNPATSHAEQHRVSDGSLLQSFPVTGGNILSPAIAVSNQHVFVPDGSVINRYDKVSGALVASQATSASSYGCTGGLYAFARGMYGIGTSATGDKAMYEVDCLHARVEKAPLPPAHGLSLATISAGYGHTCALQPSGAPYCWGLDADGELGTGATADVYTPAMALGGPSTNGNPTVVPLSAISAGQFYSCGLYNGAAYCWGRNDYGQLGNGSAAGSTSPVPVSGGLSFATISAGLYHTCGLTTAGAAYCWGRNDYGQLGNATQTSGPTSAPVAVAGGHIFSAIGAEELTTCALATDGTAWCWGNAYDGRLGNGSSDQTNTPVQAVSAADTFFVSLTVGIHHTCGVGLDHTGYCWGSGNSGELGNGVIGAAGGPTPISGTKFLSLSAGAYYTCGITTSDGSTPSGTSCWGANPDGRLGDGTTIDHSVPASVNTNVVFTAISAGGAQACGVGTDQRVYCWGGNSNGGVGNGTTTNVTTPVRVAGQ